MKKSSPKLLSMPGRVILGMVLGLATGIMLNLINPGPWCDSLFTNGIFRVGGTVFMNGFKLISGPVIFTALVLGIISMDSPQMTGRVATKALIFYALTTISAVFFGIILSIAIAPGAAGFPLEAATSAANPSSFSGWAQTIIDIVPDNFLRPFSSGIMLQIIAVAVLTGTALLFLKDKTPRLRELLYELNQFNIKIIDLIMIFAPFGVFCLLASTFASFGLQALLPLTKLFLCMVFAMFLQVALVYVPLLYFYARLSAVDFFGKFYIVIIMAFSTSSSNATLPLNLETVVKKLGVPEKIASLTLSLSRRDIKHGRLCNCNCL